jgi:fibronectin type 3 domain-containing protein
MLTTAPLRPWEIKRWERIVKKDQYAALAAQALYGKTFQLSTGRMADASQIYQKVKESDARFSMALFAADISPVVAEASGLRFTDTSVQKGERYVYRIYTSSPKISIDTAFVYISAGDTTELPKPHDVQASYTQGNAVITWDRTYIQDIYTAFIVERSDDNGATFKRLNDLPLVNTYTGATSPDRAIYTDSLPSMGRRYFYRVKGINAFAETGPPSDPVSVIGHLSANHTPVITQAIAGNNREVHLSWSYPATAEKTITGFQVERAARASGAYQILRKEINVRERQFVDTAPASNGYYRVKAIGIDESEKVSLPHLVQLIDSVPPSAPLGLNGKIDSTGLVTLSWKKNTEQDLKGYRVYRANFANDEFFQVTSGTIADTVYQDKANLQTLTKSLFYKIVAVDQNYTPSDFSAVLELKRYDKIPPVSPVFTDYSARAEGVILAWQPSSSEDVAETRLNRRVKSQALWKTVAVFRSDDTTRHYFDKEPVAGKAYEYALVAVDLSGNESGSQEPITLQRINTRARAAIRDFKAIANKQHKEIKLSWSYGDARAAKFQVYRQIGEGALMLYATISGNEAQFTDKALRINTKYGYRVKAIGNDGSESPATELIIVEY